MKKKILLIILQLVSFIVLYILSSTLLKNIYMFKWTADARYLYIWILIPVLFYFKKEFLSLLLTIGNVSGIILGQVLGDYMVRVNTEIITNAMDAEQVRHLQIHYGVAIWIVTVMVFLIIGIGIQRVKNSDEHNILPR